MFNLLLDRLEGLEEKRSRAGHQEDEHSKALPGQAGGVWGEDEYGRSPGGGSGSSKWSGDGRRIGELWQWPGGRGGAFTEQENSFWAEKHPYFNIDLIFSILLPLPILFFTIYCRY